MFAALFQATGAFKKRFSQYMILLISMNALLAVLIVGFKWLTGYVLSLLDIPYVSYTNALQIIKNPLAVLFLLIILVLLLITVYWQFAFILLGIKQIENHTFSLRYLLGSSLESVFHLTIWEVIFFIFYFVLILPLSQVIFSSKLLGKIVIPDFIIEFLQTKPLLILLTMAISILIIYIAIRMLFVLPLMILGRLRVRRAIRESLAISHGNFWRLAIAIALLTAVTRFVVYGSFLIIYGFQVFWDSIGQPYSLTFGVLNLSLVQLINLIGSAWTLVVLFRYVLLFPGMNSYFANPLQVDFRSHESTRWRFKSLSTLFLIIAGGFFLTSNIVFLSDSLGKMPLTISHRGVNDGNGVQNTIPAMARTIKDKPDYIEMDIQETKDNQFVVMHDPNLKNLTGVNRRPKQLTLRQITKLTAKENGHKAKVPSFDRYFKYAREHHQKLLIEIKTQPDDSKGMVTRFAKRYSSLIIKNNDRVHSLSYSVVQQLKQKVPQIYVSYIIPYSLTYPTSKANAYTVEQTTLDESFVEAARSQRKQVFAWTVNDPDQMDSMISMGVNAIITDKLSTLKSQINEFKGQPGYAEKILYYFITTPATTGGSNQGV
ncbi:glycerophosphodiester phosphodiesterase [Lentilactobacillus sp. Marseille-Q4993]|uniref:glycerophosphodiester phosphodiesterase n=1 Tax=Lentilactobacillus sp. Marseille-Q4993 TaxID=3039492 RepID=UPI0024BC3155|nr:glycerophosphodiester phosphodiesterase [Lentilactobacillus sp. Marseille-Q4993]